jgi:hypothetical protein
MTSKELLQAEGQELSRMLGEVLQVNGRHDFPRVPDHMDAECDLCGCWSNEWPAEQPCKKAKRFDSIPLDDWNVAMKWRDWAVRDDPIKFRAALLAVSDKWTGIIPKDNAKHRQYAYAYMVAYAETHHILRAAALCKLNKEQENG